MVVEIAPAVLAEDPESYRRDLERAVALSDRVQIDLVDGRFASNRTINLVQAYWPKEIRADIHLMYDDPFEHSEMLISSTPHLVIVHAEAKRMAVSAWEEMAQQLRDNGIKTGVALLPDTSVEAAAGLLEHADHILVFTGELGHYGGELRDDCLPKIGQAKARFSHIEAGVDGGINDQNVREVMAAGADVLNVGGFLQKADDPQAAYDKLRTEINR